MPNSQAYAVAVEIGMLARRRLLRAVIFIAITIVVVNVATVIVTTLQARDLHNATIAQNRATAALVAAKSARSQALAVASAEGIRCVLRISPSPTRPYSKTSDLINHCFAEFDRLVKER